MKGGYKTDDAFIDYKAQTTFMPRIAFSFPISDEAQFFAHYDVLTQRPPSANRIEPLDYLYMEDNRSFILCRKYRNLQWSKRSYIDAYLDTRLFLYFSRH